MFADSRLMIILISEDLKMENVPRTTTQRGDIKMTSSKQKEMRNLD